MTVEAQAKFRVVIAGGGVAGLEAMLVLADVARERVEIVLLEPRDAFAFKPLVVAEPFGLELATELELAPLLAGAGARQIREELAAVDPASHLVRTNRGTEIPYDALLVATGARPVAAVPGALTFADAGERAVFRHMLEDLGHRGARRLAFLVPPQATWAIAAYELALLTAAERASRELHNVELTLVTHERAPLELLGAPASQLVAARLADAGIELRVEAIAESYEHPRLRLSDGEHLEVDRAVALPGLAVPKLPGLPQRAGGFVDTDVRMHVTGLEGAWAAGDITSFPIKQGGLAAQQADVAARAIAARAGVHSPAEHFRPVLRAALITGTGLEFLRGGAGGDPAAGAQALWWPPSKIAGAYLGPRLAEAAGEPTEGPQVDLGASDDPAADEAERESAIELILAAADADATAGDHASALRWLVLVEQIDLVLPPEYVVKRHEWRVALDPEREPDDVTKRIEPRFASPEAGISDLRRRLGWLRELQSGGEREMEARLNDLDAGFERLRELARRASTG